MYTNLFIRLERPPALKLHQPVNIDLHFLVLATWVDFVPVVVEILDLDGSHQQVDSTVAVVVDLQALHFCSQMNLS